MKRTLIVVGIILLVAFILYRMFAGPYNKAVELEEQIPFMWAQVENQYQRRADLIPNLVNTVKGYAQHEQQTLTEVMQARASATQVKVSANDLTPEAIARYQQAQAGLTSALGRLLAVAENYPNLKANENFRDLQIQLEGTENRIALARDRFNEAVVTYNTAIRRFPMNLFASAFGFEMKGYFEAATAAEQAPTVEF